MARITSIPASHADGRKARAREPSAAISWLVLIVLLAGISAFAVEISVFASDAPRVIELAPTLLG